MVHLSIVKQQDSVQAADNSGYACCVDDIQSSSCKSAENFISLALDVRMCMLDYGGDRDG